MSSACMLDSGNGRMREIMGLAAKIKRSDRESRRFKTKTEWHEAETDQVWAVMTEPTDERRGDE
jgi:hypothetical protein